MPIPRVICCVCGQEVNKSQTLYVGDGKRACRSHEGTAEASKRECERIVQKKHAEMEKAVKREEAKHKEAESHGLEPHCLICDKKGMRQDEWYMRLMVEIKKHEIVHGKCISPFAADIQKIAGALANIACLFYVIWHGENTKVRVPYDVWQFIQTQKAIGIEEPVLLVCNDCMVATKFIGLTAERTAEIIKNDAAADIAGLLYSIISDKATKTAVDEISTSN
ncbi:MAG: hypothetical protein WC919_01080 [Candidatus Paceibacterota bacterium]|jgi:hypothetical protein